MSLADPFDRINPRLAAPPPIVLPPIAGSARSSLESDSLESMVELPPEPEPEAAPQRPDMVELSPRRQFWVTATLSLVLTLSELEMLTVAVYLMYTQKPQLVNPRNGPPLVLLTVPFHIAGCITVNIWSKAGDLWGYRVMLLITLAFVLVGQMTCAAAVLVVEGAPLGLFVVGRALAGVGVPGAAVLVSSITSSVFSPQDAMKARVKMTVTSIVCSLVTFLGVGVLVQQQMAVWCFCMAAPLAAAAFLLTWFALRLPHTQASVRDILGSLDPFGSLFLAASLVMLFTALALGGVYRPWSSAAVAGLLAGAALTLLAYLVIELRIVQYPLMPLHIFANRNVSLAIAAAFFQHVPSSVGVYAWPYIVCTFWRQCGLAAVLYSLPFYLALHLSVLASSAVLVKMGRYRTTARIANALLIVGTGVMINVDPKEGPPARLIVILVIFGIGSGAVLPPGKAAMQANVSAQYLSGTVAMASMLQMVAAALGLSLFNLVLSTTLLDGAAQLLDHINSENNTAFAWDAGMTLSERWLYLWHRLNEYWWIDYNKVLRAKAFTTAFIVLFVCALLGGVMTLFMQDREWTNIRTEVMTGIQAEEERKRIAQRRKAAKKARAAGMGVV